MCPESVRTGAELESETGMKPGIPWSVKGIDSQAREAAKDAARRSGMTLGEWLNTVIMGQSETTGPAPQLAPAVQRAQARADQEISEKLDTLSRQLSRLVTRDQATTAGRVYEAQQTAESDSALVSNVIARIDANERQAIAAFAEVEQRLEVLSQQITEAGANRYPERPEDVPGMPALETALRNVVNHIEVSEKRTRDSLKAMQDRLSETARPQSTFDGDRLLASSPKFTHLENRLGEIVNRIERSEEATQRDLRNFINGEISKLGSRLDQVRQAAESAAQKAQSSAVQTAQKELREIESRIQSLLKDTQNAMRQQQPGANDIHALRGLIGNLAKQIEAVESRIIPVQDFDALRQTVEQLSVRVAQGPDLRPLADMDRRLDEITTFLEQTRGADYGPQLGELEQRIYDLDHRVAEAMLRQPSGPGLDAVEREFTNLADRVSQNELQLQHLTSLEQSMQQLYQSFEQSRGWAREAAEEAAGRMGERLMQDWQASAPGQHFGPSPEVQALEEALESVRANMRSADQRNQETLGAIHETLEHIVNRFAELEQRPQVSGMSSLSASEPAPLVMPEAHTAYQRAEEIYAPQRPSPDSPEDAVEPAQPLAAEPSLAPPVAEAHIAAEELNELPDDFIAAARRAAQAAAQQSPTQAAAGISSLIASRKEKAAKRKLKFSLPSLGSFRKSKSKPAEEASANPEADALDTPAPLPVEPAPPLPSDGKRRRLLVIGFVLLAVASVLAVSSFYKNAKVKAPAQQSAIEQSQPTGEQKAPGSSSLMSEDMNVATAAKADAGRGTADGAGLPVSPDPAAALLPAEIGPTSLRNAAANGDPQAAFVVAGRYYEGKGIAQDFAAAANWYQKAADKGLAPAQYRLGTLFERGKGVRRDLNIALGWYERAAEAGNIKSMHNAAVLYAGNDAGRPDYAKAARWFSEASNHGLRDSQYNLAVLYERGLGVKQDLGEALFWYTLAARQNDTDAAAKAKAAEQTLPADIVADVQIRLAKWKVAPDSSPANVVSVADQAWQIEMVGSANPVIDAPVIGLAMESMEGSAGFYGQNPVEEAQRLLNRLGFEVGTPDGKMGARTANAIRRFQLQQGMSVTGEVDGALIAELKARQG